MRNEDDAAPKRAIKRPRFTKAKQDKFLATLAETGQAKAACEAAGVTVGGAFALRTRDAAFAAAWECALEQGYECLESDVIALAKGSGPAEALAGIDVAPGARKPFDPDLALKLLARRQKKDPQGRRNVVHLKQPSNQEVLAALDKKLTAMEKKLAKYPPGGRKAGPRP